MAAAPSWLKEKLGMCDKFLTTKQKGFTFIELLIFMVIIGVALAGLLAVMNITTVGSTDPMRDKQALAIAESLLEEIQSQAFTYCDPDDANASTATSPSGCAGAPQGLGPTIGESRYSEPRFDNVGDYDNMAPPTIPPIAGFPNAVADIQGQVTPALKEYVAAVKETSGLGGDEIRIDVTVSSGKTSITLTGYRYRYAPRTIP